MKKIQYSILYISIIFALGVLIWCFHSPMHLNLGIEGLAQNIPFLSRAVLGHSSILLTISILLLAAILVARIVFRNESENFVKILIIIQPIVILVMLVVLIGMRLFVDWTLGV